MLSADGYVVGVRVALKAAAADCEAIAQRHKWRDVGDGHRRCSGLWDDHCSGLARTYGDPGEEWAVAGWYREFRAAGGVGANYLTISYVHRNAGNQAAGGV